MGDNNIEDALQPDVFNFLDVLSERSFPKDVVSVYLNEDAAYQARLARRKLLEAETKAEVAEADKLIKKYNEEVKKSEYKFHISGTSMERVEALIELAKEKFPVETKTRKTASGALEQYEVESNERREYLTYLTIWVHVEAIEAPDGRKQVAPDIETIISFIKKAPPSQVEKFANAIRSLEVSSELFEDAIDDDFLAKS